MERLLDPQWLQDSQVIEFFRIRQQAWLKLIKENQINVAMFVFFVFMTIRQIRAKQQAAQKAGAERGYCDAPGFPEVETLEDFRWQDERPVKLRSFKPKYYLTMGESVGVATHALAYTSAY